MSSCGKLLLAASIVGGVCGIAGAAIYVNWRAEHHTIGRRTSTVLRQLTDAADRLERALGPAGEAPAEPSTETC